MKTMLKSFVLALTALLLLVPFASAAHHQSIVDIAVADGRFTTLVAAVQAAGLVDALSEGEWTVFAPTDDAFAKLGLNAGNIASSFSKTDLTDILLYHAIPGAVTSDVAMTLVGDVTMANGKIAGLKVFEDDLYVNDDSKVIIPDIVANNGLIHVVDTVILGPWPKVDAAPSADSSVTSAPQGSTIVDIAVADGRFDTLVAAVVAADLAGALSSGDWTVFAPTDDAFAKLGLNAGNIASSFTKAQLTDILLYHVIGRGIGSAEAIALAGDVTMANGAQAGLKVFEDELYVNDDAKVIIPDIVTSNGVIHVVDTVVLGPWPRIEDVVSNEWAAGGPTAAAQGSTIVDIAVADGRFDTLVAAVVAADLAGTLSSGDWTVFAPTDDAFAKLGLNAGNIASSFSKVDLTDILLYHVRARGLHSEELKMYVGDITMANGAIAGLKVFEDDLYINDDSKVIVPNVDADNGVIHAVDTVILGPWPR